MILLDTNYLINLLVPGTAEAERVRLWYSDEDLCTSAICWYEFLCGPADPEGVIVVRSVLHDRIIPFTADQAAESARIFNATGRLRRLRVDAMIAAAAIVSNATIATANTADFTVFRPFGLRLQ